MRLIDVARKLGMTGQQLRHELQQVNFGVKPTDHEVPDNLAYGIIRFLSQKLDIAVQSDLPPIDEQKIEVIAPPPSAPPPPSPPIAPTTSSPPSKLNIMRKLTLEAPLHRPPRPAPRPILTKQQREEMLKEQKLLRRQEQERRRTLTAQQQIKAKSGLVELPDVITVKELAEKAGVQVPHVITALMKNGVLATLNQQIDFESAAIVAAELGVTVRRAHATASAEQLLSRNLQELTQDEPERLSPRPPIVTVMGHVDHGKTSLLDAIRRTNVAAREAGGITQHIGASEIERVGRRITFLDTPGHEAFTAMRARGAQVTDIVVLVVAADEGVQPTTVEAIHHAREADVPLVVALTKVDLPNAQPDRVKGQLAEQDLRPAEWGGTTAVLPCSAKTGQGIGDLLDHLLLLAEERQLQANPNRPAVATVIESHLDPSLGPLASVLVNTGTLRQGDVVVCGTTWGRVKLIRDAHGETLQELRPSSAARVAGFQAVPSVGDILQVQQSEHQVKDLADSIASAQHLQRQRPNQDLVLRLSQGKVTILKIILKADAQGSLEAIERSLSSLSLSGTIAPKVIHSAVGAITEGDVMMASASQAIVLGFNVEATSHIQKNARAEGVRVQFYDVIYKLLDDVTALLSGLVEPEEMERITGHLEVRGLFFTKGKEQIIGGKVLDGTLKRLPFRMLREGKQVGMGLIVSVRNVDRDIKEAKEGSECGLRIDSSTPIVLGDILEAYSRELKRKVAASS